MHAELGAEPCFGVRFGIGGIVVELLSRDPNAPLPVSQPYKSFVVEARPDVVLEVCPVRGAAVASAQRLFDSGGRWVLDQRAGGGLLLSFDAAWPSGDSQGLVVLDPDLSSGTVHFWSASGQRNPIPPLLPYPLGHILFVNLFSRGLGHVCHAAGVIDHGRGLLFAGVGDAGKSTLSRLWSSKEGVDVLSDDRVVVRKKGAQFWLYGTPWHGDAKLYSPAAAPLDRIFVIEHGGRNEVEPLSPASAMTSLLVRSSPAFWSRDGLAYALEFCAELVRSVPCHRLAFVPDETVIEFLRSLP